MMLDALIKLFLEKKSVFVLQVRASDTPGRAPDKSQMRDPKQGPKSITIWKVCCHI